MSLCEASDDLKKKYASRVPKAEVVDGLVFSGLLTSYKKWQSLADLELGPDDIIIASYPKSGSTPISEIVSAITHEGNLEAIKSIRLDQRVPWLELDKEGFPDGHPLKAPANFSASKKRVYFTHVSSEFLPKSIVEGKGKLLYVAKQPKDTAIAYFLYHHQAKFLKNEVDLSWDEFFPLFCSGYLCYGNWFKHAANYFKLAKNNNNVKFIHFEDMQKSLASTVKDLEQFVGVPLTEDKRDAVVHYCSKLTGREELQQLSAEFERKGTNWKNYFSVAQNEAFEALLKAEFEGTELEFH